MRFNLENGKFVVVSYMMLSFLVLIISGCSRPTTVTDLVPNISSPDVAFHKIDGTVQVKTSTPSSTTNPTYKSMNVSEWIDSAKLQEAIEISIRKQGIFSEVSPRQSDYVLEVWVDKVQNMLEITGEGFIFDLLSVWRLTRVDNDEIVVCEFVKGHGASRKFADKAYPAGISAATRDMLQKGLHAVSDQTQSHLSALSIAEHRPAIPPTN